MKKLTLLICVCLCAATVASGQAVKLGIFGGPNFSGIGSQNVGGEWNSQPRLAFHIGVYTEIGGGHWSLEPALVYAQIGAKINSDSFDNNSNETVAAQYLQIPVNLVYNTTGRKFFFGVGPYAGLGLAVSVNGNATYGGISGSPQGNGDTPYALNYNDKFTNGRLDYGITLLAGAHLKGGTIFTLGGSLGLKKATINDIFTIRNDVISVSIGHSIF